MRPMSSRVGRGRLFILTSGFSSALLFLAIFFSYIPSTSASPLPGTGVRAIPAFARKYGLPCSACHEAWPKLNNFGQAFRDNGYQLGNDRDAPLTQVPSYWPITFRITPQWHRESNQRVAVDNIPGDATSGQSEKRVSTSGFDTS